MLATDTSYSSRKFLQSRDRQPLNTIRHSKGQVSNVLKGEGPHLPKADAKSKPFGVEWDYFETLRRRGVPPVRESYSAFERKIESTSLVQLDATRASTFNRS